MTTEQPKAAPAQEHPYPPAPVPYPHPYNSAPYPPHAPPGAYGSFYPYPPPPDGGPGENGQNGAPPGYMMFHPHPPPTGMVFAYNPPQSTSFNAPPPNNQAPPTLVRPKRKQVKMACTNCAAACKRCDEGRPCERCMKYGVADTCVDGQRKERKKGVKRGPYKRKNKMGTADSPPFGEPSADGEWSPGAPPATTPATTVAAIQAVTHQFPNGEGFYPMYYPPHAPGPYLPPPPHDGQPGGDGQPPHPNGMPYYIHGAYPPPFGHYPPFMHGAPPPPLPQPQAQAQSQTAQTVDPAATNAGKEITETVSNNHVSQVAPEDGKKRARGTKGGDTKAKKAKRGGNDLKEKEDTAKEEGTEGD